MKTFRTSFDNYLKNCFDDCLDEFFSSCLTSFLKSILWTWKILTQQNLGLLCCKKRQKKVPTKKLVWGIMGHLKFLNDTLEVPYSPNQFLGRDFFLPFLTANRLLQKYFYGFLRCKNCWYKQLPIFQKELCEVTKSLT